MIKVEEEEKNNSHYFPMCVLIIASFSHIHLFTLPGHHKPAV